MLGWTIALKLIGHTHNTHITLCSSTLARSHLQRDWLKVNIQGHKKVYQHMNNYTSVFFPRVISKLHCAEAGTTEAGATEAGTTEAGATEAGRRYWGRQALLRQALLQTYSSITRSAKPCQLVLNMATTINYTPQYSMQHTTGFVCDWQNSWLTKFIKHVYKKKTFNTSLHIRKESTSLIYDVHGKHAIWYNSALWF